jgi:hypothetical protein
MESRFDSAPVGNARRDGRGFLLVPGHVTRTGVFKYKRADGTTVNELRHPDDVFETASLASLEGASVTELHPNSFVTPENAHQHEVGFASAGRKDGGFVAAELSVRRASTIGKVERKELSELSCSYTLKIDPTPGVYNGQRYDQRQKDIRYNHVALGPKGWGRGGENVRVRMDAEAAFLDDDTQESGAAGDAPRTGETRADNASVAPNVRSDPAQGEPGRSASDTPSERRGTMKKIRIDGVEYEVDDKVAAAYEAERSRADGLQTRADQAITRADSAQGREDALRTQLGTMTTERDTARTELATANDPAKRSDAVKTRVALERSAVKVLGDKAELGALTDRQVREKAILAVDKTAKLEGRSDDYVSGQFDVLVVNGKRNDGLAIVQSAITTGEQVRGDAASQAAAGKDGAKEDPIQKRLDAAQAQLDAAGKPAKKEG